MKKKFVSLLLALVMVAGLMPIAVAEASGFTPRTTAPKSTETYYTYDNPFYNAGYGMPNCTCYAWGRAYEILGSRPNLSTADAGAWYDYNKNNNIYSYSNDQSKPALGAIVCWTTHVAVVEAIDGNTITVSESIWQGDYFRTSKRSLTARNLEQGGTFQGYIYLRGNGGSSTKPTNPKITTDKSALTLGDTIKITPSADNAGSYEISIWYGAFDSGEKVYSKLDFTGSATYTPTKTGNYTIRMDAISSGGRSAGYASTEATFTVNAASAPIPTPTQAPSNVRVITDKSSYIEGETITITPSATNATDYELVIRFQFTDGTGFTAFSGKITGEKTYTTPGAGRCEIVLTASNSAGSAKAVTLVSVEEKSTSTPTVRFEIRGRVDSTEEEYTNIEKYATVDVYINGNLVANDVSRYREEWPVGTTYKITDIKTINNFEYVRVTQSGLSGSMTDTPSGMNIAILHFEPAVHTHTLTHTPAKAATCTAEGNLEYWYCEGCGKYFLDETATLETSLLDVIREPLGHDYGEDGVCFRCGELDPEHQEEPVIERDDPHFERQTIFFGDQFTDIPANQWFTGSVAEAYELGLMKGSSDTTFNPYGDVTLAEAITMAARIHSIYTTGEESFVQTGKWYQVYLDYAYNNGIISRAYYNADVTRKATRAQFAEIFANALPDKALYPMNTIADGAIPDVSTAENYAPYVYKLYRAGILTGGDANGTFSPLTYITRAEAAAIVSRMAEANNRVSFTLA